MYNGCEFVEVCVKVPRAAANTLKQLAQLLCANQQDEIEDDCVIMKSMPKATRAGQMLKGMRLRAEMTQQELAKAINVPQAHISQYERSIRRIPLHKAQKLAQILETTVDDFLN